MQTYSTFPASLATLSLLVSPAFHVARAAVAFLQIMAHLMELGCVVHSVIMLGTL